MTRDELKKKRKEIAESNGYKGYVPKNRQMREEQARNPEPVQEKKSTWSNVMGRIGSAVGNTMDYISGGQVQQKLNRNNTINNNLARDNSQRNTSLRQDVRDMGQIVGQSVKGLGQKSMNYIENATLNNFSGYREKQKQLGEAEYIKETNKPIITARDKQGNRQILSDVSVTPTKDKINKAIDETEGKIQTLTEKQNNPVTRKLSELLPSITQSVVGMGASAINPAVRSNILANFCWWRLCETS